MRSRWPTASAIALLVNPTDSVYAEMQSHEALAAAHIMGVGLHVLNARSERDFDEVFAKLIASRVGGLVIAEEALFTSRSELLAALVSGHVPGHDPVSRPDLDARRRVASLGGDAGSPQRNDQLVGKAP